MSPTTGALYLIPTSLGEQSWDTTVPPAVREKMCELDYFVVENAKTARAQLKRVAYPHPLQSVEMHELPKHGSGHDLHPLLAPLLAGKSAGLMSEAGCPAVADPGALLVRAAHEKGIRVVPLVGPSSLLLALMASGLNGQRFAFQGYLPVPEAEREKSISRLEAESLRLDQTELVIETPYRNDALFVSLRRTCKPTTLLCVASDLLLPTQEISTQSIAVWRTIPQPKLAKRPTVFLFLAQAAKAR
ncbi:MAG: SAM-dependent methyltransferase [Rhodocyclaceae bacterium]